MFVDVHLQLGQFCDQICTFRSIQNIAAAVVVVVVVARYG
jgi:hypothetical protein